LIYRNGTQNFISLTLQNSSVEALRTWVWIGTQIVLIIISLYLWNIYKKEKRERERKVNYSTNPSKTIAL